MVYVGDKNALNEMIDYYDELFDEMESWREDTQKLKKLLEEKNNYQIFIDTQDMEERYAEGLYQEYLEEENKKYKKVIDKAIKCIDYNTKYRNGADIYQFIDIESEILEPLKYILESDEKNGNAYLKEFNDWLKEVE